jgi:hypothetical protein
LGGLGKSDMLASPQVEVLHTWSQLHVWNASHGRDQGDAGGPHPIKNHTT